MFSRLTQAARKRRAYLRTKHEIEHMPADVARDLNIDRACAAQIAAQAVYG